MKFTFNWLKEFVSLDGSPQALAQSLTMAGLEVESVSPVCEPESERADWLFEIAVTPNRGDCLGLLGLAREVSALTGIAAKLFSDSRPAKGSLRKLVTIVIDDPALCARYSARIVDNLHIEPAPAWMRFRLESCGIRPINNVVDITNYVMLETGQPLHAFDRERLSESRIHVRPAREIRDFTTLDGVERELAHEDLLICAGDTPVALAGIMGGMESEVRAQTRSVLIESANFAPIAIRRTAKRLGLHSEASHRFERGVDPEGTLLALGRAVWLLEQHGGGTPAKGVADHYARKPRPATITLREQRIEKILGVSSDGKRAEKLLRALGLKARRRAKTKSIKVTLATHRPDLAREADLVEELARLQGYENIPTILPPLRAADGANNVQLGWERRIRSFLAGAGLVEVINLPFTTEARNRLFTGLWSDGSEAIAVLNPLAKENAEMRLSLLPGLINNLQTNLAHKAESFHAFHLGKTFRTGGAERYSLAALLYGVRPRHGLREQQAAPLGFLDCKGLVESLFDVLHISAPVQWNSAPQPFLHPGRSALLGVGGRSLGYLGEIHPNLCEQMEVPPFVLVELDFEELLQYAPRQLTAQILPRFPSVERDFAVVVDRDFPSQRIVSWINGLAEALIERTEVFDQYLGAPIPEGKKSLAYKILYRAEDRTLTDSEINTLHQSLVEKAGIIFGAERRS